MGATRNTGYIENLIAYDGNNNIGVGGPVNVLYKVTIGGNTLISGNLNVTGTITFSSNVTANSFVKNGGVATEFLKADGTVDTSTYATVSYVDTSISNLIDAAPAALNTLNELAAALGDDSSFSTTVTTALGNRLRIDTDAQGLTSEQKANGRTNLGVVIGTDVQAYDADLGAIAALTGTSGFLKKTAANTWTLDTNTYITGGFIGTTALQSSSATQAMTGISSIEFVGHVNDVAKIEVTTNAAITYFDFTLADDNNQEEWRWRFNPTGGTIYSAMRLVPTTNTTSNLIVSGTIAASNFSGSSSGTNTGDQDLSGYQPLLTNPVTGTGTTNRIAYWNSVNSIAALDTASYPTLTELSYVKGVTSAIQTQINAITANYVTTNTTQEITVVKTFKSDDAAGLHFKNAAGTFVGALSTYKQWFSGGTSTDLALGAKANLYLFSNDGSNWAVKIDTNRDAIFASKVKIDGGTSSQFLKANGDLDSNTYLTSNFDVTGTVRARAARTTYRDNSTNPSTDAPIRSLTNTNDNWIYLDSANTEWGIYHRNIDTDLVVSGQRTLKANSIAFIGGNNLQAYICLADGELFAKSVNINGNTAWHAGNLTPQTQLNGTGFVKASGTTISYDNNNYTVVKSGSLTLPAGSYNGWYRIGISSQAVGGFGGRGAFKFVIAQTGNNLTPAQVTIDGYKDWSNGVVLGSVQDYNSATIFTQFRIATSGDYSYLEAFINWTSPAGGQDLAVLCYDNGHNGNTWSVLTGNITVGTVSPSTTYTLSRVNNTANYAGLAVGGNSVWTTGSLTNLNQLTNGPGFITQTNALQPIYGDSGAHNLNVSGQQANIRYSTGLWVNGPTTGNYSHVISFNLASDNRTVQMYLGDVPGYLWWRPNQAGTWHPWERILTSNNVGSFALPISGGYVNGVVGIGHDNSTPSSATGWNGSSVARLQSGSTGGNVYLEFRTRADVGDYAGLIFTDNNNGGYIAWRNYVGAGANDGTNGDYMLYGTYTDHIFQAGSSNNINGKPEVFRIFANGNTRATGSSIASSGIFTAGDGGAGSQSTVVAIRVRGLNAYDSLELGIENNYAGVIRSYGNDIRYYSGHWKTVGTAATEDHSHYWYTSRNGSTDWSNVKMRLDHTGQLTLNYGPLVLDWTNAYLYIKSLNSGSGVQWHDQIWLGRYDRIQTAAQYPNYLPGIAYGIHITQTSDAAFFGLIGRGANYNDYNCVIAWGDDSPEDVFQYRFNNNVIGTITPSGALTMSSDITAFSDIRIKENITTIDNALEKVLKLRGVYYNRTDLKFDKSRKVGFIAQEVKDVIPEIVTYDEQIDRYAVTYGNTVAILVEAIKEQQKQIEELKSQIKNK